MCRMHGLVTDTDVSMWTSRSRTPALYPDAVTLAPDISVDWLLDRIDRSPGCSIKDSFASLDLADHGFRVLFDGHWIVREPNESLVVAAGPRWTVVSGADAFVSWEIAWRGRNGPVDVLRPGLLSLSAVTVLAALVDERIVGGAVINQGPKVIGISNFFTEGERRSENWRGCLAFIDTLFPGATLVGYESGVILDLVRSLGVVTAGPMRVSVNQPNGGPQERPRRRAGRTRLHQRRTLQPRIAALPRPQTIGPRSGVGVRRRVSSPIKRVCQG